MRFGYNGGAVCPEWNLKANVPAAKTALLAPWKQAVITPLDTCGLVRLGGERFAALKRCPDPVIRALLENYRLWAGKGAVDELTESSVLFDTVAVYLAWPGAKPLLCLEDLRIDVRDDGTTAIALGGAAAVTGLKAAGFKGVVAKSFGRIFYRNAINEGVPVIECPEAYGLIASGDEVEIDLERSEIRAPHGTFSFPPASPSVRRILRMGGLTPYLKDLLAREKGGR